MKRLGLFEQLFARVLALMGALVLLLIVFTHVFQQRYLDETRIADLQQETEWIARHWGGDVPQDALARAWQATHRWVRLSVLDGSGTTIADSDTDAAPIGLDSSPARSLLIARARIALPQGSGTLVLSRRRTPVFPADLGWELLLWIFGIVALAALAFYPLVRKLTATLARLAGLARRVADGQFGATLEHSGQRELADLITSFNDMSLRLRREELRKRRLLVDVSHELRSPMGRLRALAETILRRPHEAAPHLQQLEAEIGLLDRLVGDMLETARFEQGAVVLAKQTLPLAHWVEQAFARVQPRIEQAGVTVAMKLAPTRAHAAIDPERMIQVIGNLVDNALAATQGRSEPRIDLSLTTSTESWDLCVADNGRGIPETDLPFVFERFFRVEHDRGRATGGSGLGLSIVQAIVEAHGGRIAIDSVVDSGTRVSLSFPWDAAAGV